MKKAIKTKQEYGGLEKSQPKAAKIPGRALAIEGEKTLAITDGKSLIGDGDVSKQNRTENIPTPIARPNQHGAIVPGKLIKRAVWLKGKKSPHFWLELSKNLQFLRRNEEFFYRKLVKINPK
jgi:hypothetical protein